MLKSGTSIGANVEEAIGAQSKADFISKLPVSYKEARETVYRLKLLKSSEYLNTEVADALLAEAEEISRILGKIQISSKQNHNPPRNS